MKKLAFATAVALTLTFGTAYAEEGCVSAKDCQSMQSRVSPVFAFTSSVQELKDDQMAVVKGTAGYAAYYGSIGDADLASANSFANSGRFYYTGTTAAYNYAMAAIYSGLAAGYYGFAAYFALNNN